MTMPNFLVLGAMKAGTTSLQAVLDQHPQIYVGEKEPEFFSYYGLPHSRDAVPTLEAYQALFDGVKDEVAIGEVSSTYLPSPRAAEQIKQLAPDAKLIAILRDPVERAYSHYNMLLKAKGSHLNQGFLEFFQQHRDNTDWWRTISYRGCYGEHLERYYNLFDANQIRVYLYHEYVKKPADTIKDLYTFVGVDPSFEPEQRWFWRTGMPRSRLLYKLNIGSNWPPTLVRLAKTYGPVRLITSIRLYLDRKNTQKAPPISPEARAELRMFYRDDILKLQSLIQCDLSAWLD